MRNSPNLFLALSLLSGQFLFSQSVSWAKATSRYQRAIATNEGNIAVLSTYNDSSWPLQNDTITYTDASGNMLWKKVLPGELRITAFSSASGGGFFVGGYFGGTVQFNGHQFAPGQHRRNLWLARWAADGSFDWVRHGSSSYNAYISDISSRGGILAICGAVSDSVEFMSESAVLSSRPQAFLATLSENGDLENFIYSKSTTTVVGNNSFESASLEQQCALDAQGSVYLMMRTFGRTEVDTFHFGYWNDYNEYGPITTAIIKFDVNLIPKRLTVLNDCIYYCNQFKNFQVNSKGECYYTRTAIYAQSGNDEMSSFVHKVNQDGSKGAVYEVSQTDRNYLSDLQIDQCERLVYTGYRRDYIESQVPGYTLMVGQMNDDLTVNWSYEHNTSNNYLAGNSVALLTNGNYMVTGVYTGTIQLTQSSPVIFSNNEGGYQALVNVPAQFKCVTTTVPEFNKNGLAVSMFPNPATNYFTISSDSPIELITVSSITGQQMIQTNDIKVNTSKLSPGIYVVKIETPRGTETRRLVIQK